MCWNKYADDSLEFAETQKAFFGTIIHPYRVQYKTDNFLTDLTREEFIDSIKRGKTTILPINIEGCVDILKQNLLIVQENM